MGSDRFRNFGHYLLHLLNLALIIMNEVEISAKIKTAQINNALGIFILTFGVIVIFAMVYTETLVQQMTDLVAGMVLVVIGGGMVWNSKRKIKKLKKTSDK